MTPATILIVEDEAIVALDLQMQLEELGYEVVGTADEGAAALALAERHQPDLVLMDVHLKGPADGVQTAAALARRAPVPVVYLTAHSDDHTVRRAADTAPYGYLTKPFQIRELRAAIEVALTKSRMERQLHDSERWFASTLQCVADGVVLTGLDGRVRFVNPSAEALLGCRNEQVLGRPVGDLVRFAAGAADADAPAAGRPSEAVAQALRDGAVVGIEHGLRLLAADGRHVPVDQSASPIDDEHGRRLGAVLVLRDATRRLAQEARLRASEERFRNAFDHAPLGMALVAFDGHFLQVNAALCRFLGCEAAQLRRRRHDRLTWPADRAHERARLRALLDGEAPVVQFEMRYRAPDPAAPPLWALVSVSLLREDDEPTCWLYQVHDLSPQRAAAEQLAELASERLARRASEIADQTKSEFLSRASHEMRTPLNAVLGFSDLLAQDSAALDPARVQRFARHIHHAGEHLLAMVNDVLDLQRAAQGQLRLQLEPLALAEVVDQACELLAPQAEAQGLGLVVQVDAGLRVRADATRLRQVLLNLGSNAIKYNRRGGEVRLQAEPADAGQVRLTLSDTGCGMSPAQLARLFQPFERLGQERGGIPGTGLGLLIARQLVDAMGGALAVHSEAGVGTRATLLLPAV